MAVLGILGYYKSVMTQLRDISQLWLTAMFNCGRIILTIFMLSCCPILARKLEKNSRHWETAKKVRRLNKSLAWHTQRPLRTGSLAWVEIPWDMADILQEVHIPTNPVSNPNLKLSRILQRISRQKRRANEEWVTVIDQATLEKLVLLFCQQHFNQASQTSFGSGHSSRLLEGLGLTTLG